MPITNIPAPRLIGPTTQDFANAQNVVQSIQEAPGRIRLVKAQAANLEASAAARTSETAFSERTADDRAATVSGRRSLVEQGVAEGDRQASDALANDASLLNTFDALSSELANSPDISDQVLGVALRENPSYAESFVASDGDIESFPLRGRERVNAIYSALDPERGRIAEEQDLKRRAGEAELARFQQQTAEARARTDQLQAETIAFQSGQISPAKMAESNRLTMEQVFKVGGKVDEIDAKIAGITALQDELDAVPAGAPVPASLLDQIGVSSGANTFTAQQKMIRERAELEARKVTFQADLASLIPNLQDVADAQKAIMFQRYGIRVQGSLEEETIQPPPQEELSAAEADQAIQETSQVIDSLMASLRPGLLGGAVPETAYQQVIEDLANNGLAPNFPLMQEQLVRDPGLRALPEVLKRRLLLIAKSVQDRSPILQLEEAGLVGGVVDPSLEPERFGEDGRNLLTSGVNPISDTLFLAREALSPAGDTIRGNISTLRRGLRSVNTDLR